MNRNKRARRAMVMSFCLMLMWLILGAGTTIAWFTDTTTAIRNAFHIGELELDVAYKNQDMTDYETLEAESPVFSENALYEPGYTQVVYLRIGNSGTVDFDYKLAVDCRSYVDSINVFGGRLHLPAYLRFGVLFADSEPELERKTAQALADLELLEEVVLNQYSKVDDVTVAPGDYRYAALIVWMPEEIGNEANCRGQTPVVELGITVFAQQAGAPLE